MAKKKPSNPEQAREAKKIRDQIHRAYRADDLRTARVLLQDFRKRKLFCVLGSGYQSFHAWAKNDSPWPVAYSYQLSKPAEKSNDDFPLEKGTASFTCQDTQGSIAPCPPCEPAQPADEMIPLVDHAGQTIKMPLEHIFRVGNQHFFEIMASIETIRVRLRSVCSHASGANLALYNRAEVMRQHLDSMEGVIRRCRPWAQCPYCVERYTDRSLNRHECHTCNSKGWLTHDQWAEATKAQRTPV